MIRGAEEFIRTRMEADYRRLGRAMVLQSIRLGVQRAHRYGLREEAHVFRYINVMYTLGFEFDEDPRYSWASAILGRGSLTPESKLDLLCARVVRELKTADE